MDKLFLHKKLHYINKVLPQAVASYNCKKPFILLHLASCLEKCNAKIYENQAELLFYAKDHCVKITEEVVK